MYKENPKTKGSGIYCAIPQTERCPNNCEDCFFQSGRSFLVKDGSRLEDNLPNMPYDKDFIVIRVNDGNDSNVDRELVMDEVFGYPMKFYNTAIPRDLEEFEEPFVLTINPGHLTDKEWHKILDPIPQNLMFVRIRTNTWNLSDVVYPAVMYYTKREVPVVLTFMAYYDTPEKIPLSHKKNYVFRMRTLNSYFAITTEAWEGVMETFKYNKWVHCCGKIEGEKGDTHCRFCGNCLREYFATKERTRND